MQAPVSFPHANAANSLFEGRPAVQGRRLLIVEDDVDLQTILVRIVRSVDRDLRVDWAVNARQAVRLLVRRSYQAILADCMLDGRRSGEALQEVCTSLQPRAPFALMSALPAPEAPAGARPPFLRKPFSTAGCRQFVANLLAASRSGVPKHAFSFDGSPLAVRRR
jgi:DNA-binding NtrC family response regulator